MAVITLGAPSVAESVGWPPSAAGRLGWSSFDLLGVGGVGGKGLSERLLWAELCRSEERSTSCHQGCPRSDCSFSTQPLPLDQDVDHASRQLHGLSDHRSGCVSVHAWLVKAGVERCAR